jgi:hypothetical protein
MKNPAQFIIYFILIGLLFTACKKEKDLVPEQDVDATSSSSSVGIFAGVYDTSFTYTQLQPAMEIIVTWDNQNLYGLGSDSLDIDADGNYDLIMNLSLLNMDSVHLLSGFPSPFPYCVIRTNNGLEVNMETEIYPIGLGQEASADFVADMALNESINQSSDWLYPSTSGAVIWAENPGTVGVPPYGDWYYINATRYIGIQLNNKFGWIEVDATDAKNPKIVSYAIQH